MAVHPFDISKYPVRQAFGVRNRAYRLGFHPGTDYGTPTGVAVRAPEAGLVRWLWSNTYGNVAALIRPNGDVIWFAHNSRPGKTGQVNKGDVIAYTGNTGWSTGPHSHIEYRLGGDQNRPIDFHKWLLSNPEPRPVPTPSGMPRIGSSVRFTVPRTAFVAGTTIVKGTLPADVRIVRGYDPKYPNRILVNSASLGNGVAVALYYTNGKKIDGWQQI